MEGGLLHRGVFVILSTMKIRAFAGGVLLTLGCLGAGARPDLAQHVNPYVGCAFNGHCFAAAAYPFGMIQAGPDTGTESWDYCSGYRYADTNIYGFSQTHLSGTGCNDLGDLLLMPWSGDGLAAGVTSRYRKETQTATPGFYAVTLDDADVAVKIAVTPHAAIYEFVYGKRGRPQLMVDAQWGIVFPNNLAKHVLESDIRADGAFGLVGRNRIRNWVDREYSFVLKADHPISSRVELPRRPGEKAGRHVLTFDADPGETVRVKVALSTTDVDGARRNLEAEIPGWDFMGVRQTARAAWNGYLGRMEMTGGTADALASFYTALYHLCIQPNNIADVDGRYRGADGQIRTSPDGRYFSTLSLWDTFRAAHPLYTIIAPELVPSFVNTMVAHSKAAGYLPIWTLWGKENQCMIGTHSVPVIVDAFLKDVARSGSVEAVLADGKVDWKAAYAAVSDSLRNAHQGRKKERWDLLDRYGYYPFDVIRGESVSRTLECAYDDACAARFAAALDLTDDAAFFARRAQNYRNVFDSKAQLMRGRDTKGGWRTPFDPFLLGHGANTPNDFTEGNAWQYTWHVMHDPEGLMSLFGSKLAFASKLDSLFIQPEKIEGSGFVLDVSGLIGQYAHGNEPSHHVAYFYTLAGQPVRTAEVVREICDRFYQNKIDGLCGNDDCGQMSAWYLFSAAGFYPFDPCGGEYVLGAPQVPDVAFTLPGGRIFRVKASGLSRENKYVRRVMLNGRPLDGFKLTHRQILAGGELVFEMCGREDGVLSQTAPAFMRRGAKKRLVCLDLDATLSQHRTAPPAKNLAVLGELQKRYKCIMVGAGNAPRIHRQMGEYPIDILANYGMQEARMVDGKFTIVRQETNHVDRAFFRRETDKLRKKYGYVDYMGEPVEFHPSGMVTFGLLGTSPAAEHKVSFDPDRAKRRAMYPEVCEIFKDYSVFIGGSTSFDFAGPRNNKYDCIMDYAKREGYTRDEIIFIGDDFGDGGGDSHVRIKGMDYIYVDDYRKFPERVACLLK